MKSIYRLLVNFVKEDFSFLTYAYTFLFLASCTLINYQLDFEDSILDSSFGTPISFFHYTAFYMFAYYGISIPQLFFTKKQSRLLTIEYWFRSLFFLSVIGFSAFFYFHRNIDLQFLSFGDQNYVRLLIIQLSPVVSVIVPLLLFWLIFDQNRAHIYGLRLKNANLRPYFQMLLIMFPLVFAASYLPDFQENYPITKPWLISSGLGWNDWQYFALFEPLYGISFLSVEMVFRGALVIGMAKVLGKEAILPMVSVYAFLHFGKPMGEAIGSIFGGYVLGVIALKKEHIFGGFIIHVGVAYLMELTALWQHYYN